MTSTERLTAAHDAALRDLEEQTAALTARACQQINESIDALFAEYMNRPRDVAEDGFGRRIQIVSGD